MRTAAKVVTTILAAVRLSLLRDVDIVFSNTIPPITFNDAIDPRSSDALIQGNGQRVRRSTQRA